MTYPRHILTKTAFTPGGPAGNGSAPGIWRLEEVAYWQKQGVWPDPNILPDSNFKYVSLLLSTTSLGNANNNLFVDSSGAFNPISRAGNTTQGSFAPYSSRWSWNFAGVASRYFSIGASSAFALGTGDFTLEAWFQQSAKSFNYPRFFNLGPSNWDTSDSAALIIDGNSYPGKISFETWSGIAVVSTTTVQNGTWYHVVLTRSGSTFKLYVNGVLETTVTSSTAITTSATVACRVGAGGYSNDSFNGNVSNLRLVKGSVVYGSNFTPSTTPLTAISGTSLLTCQSNRYIDASSNAFTMTSSTGQNTPSTVDNDFAKVTSYTPFASSTYTPIAYNQSDITNWSGYFDGTGDNLTIPSNAAFGFGTGDFTIEFWAYIPTWTSDAQLIGCHTAFVGFDWLIQQFSSGQFRWLDASLTLQSGAVPVTNQWNHYAVTRSGTTLRIFLNGTQTASGTSTANIPATRALGIMGDTGASSTQIGYMSNVRIVKGTAVYTSNFTPPTSALTAISGTSLLTCQNATFTDNSTNNFAITINGNTTISGNSPFNTVGYWSNRFSSGNYLTVPNSTPLNLSGGTYTIEMWINPDGDYGNYNTLVAKRVLGSSSTAWEVYLNTGNGYLGFYNGTNFLSSTTPSPSVWSHVAAVYDGTNMNLYLNGTRVLQSSASNNDVSANIQIGTFSSYDERFIGNMSNLRITKGAALYSGSSFTPPTGPLTTTVSSGTVSLLTCQSPQFIDNSANTASITITGSPLVQAINPFYTATIGSNSGSIYFDGTGDYLTAPSSTAYHFNTSNFTIEGWFYFTNASVNALQTIYSNYTNFSSAGSIFFGKHTYSGGTVQVFISNYSTGGPLLSDPNLPPNNAWTHYALVRNGNTFTLYRNGVSVSSASWSGAATSGSCPAFIGAAGDVLGTYHFNGYMSGFRISKTAVYTAAFTPPTTPLSPTTSTTLLLNGMNAGIYDATAINDFETIGDAKVTTAVYKYGTSSMAFDGSGDYIVSRGNTILLGNSNFTVEFWVYFNAVNNGTVKYLYDFRTASATSASFLAQEASNDWTYWDGSGTGVTTGLNSSTFATGQWYHVAITRSSNVLYCFVNGIKVSSNPTDSSNYASSTLTLGARYSGSNSLNGYIDDVRLTSGVARYTSNFTPPTTTFPLY